MKIRLNKYPDAPREFIYRYFLKFGVKFPVYVKTLYKWIRLGFYGFLKQNLRHRGKRKIKIFLIFLNLWLIFVIFIILFN
uniref:Tranposase of is30 family n-terminal and c-terminal truncated protein n=1 Tax=Spiroplasma citri TaxID=2133 RepID=Q14NN3_SPICI|nr:tranposase of is30 family n-terminal and c-terminal truncated protein [Spiroplasma citri]